MSAIAPNPMMALLAAHAAQQQGAGPPGMMGGPDVQGGPEPQQDAVPALLRQAIDALHRAFAAETEPIDREMIGKAMLLVQQIFAQEQKEKDQVLGGPGVRAMRRNR